ncbi:tyrosine-protein phosphatase non-receptor type 13-like isoform X2 [Corticium candelabrum]|uniref:tyrosine-protein phosphatase non-receptor type 13-like isoform X2 n=1 Tax=Corticium candelabrum TaxID=121492 RepID=UPI002E260274|nr:tyrosine-protein phosphatase non-receptor type 13-like isoform X2 [Corticium candelabrum]
MPGLTGFEVTLADVLVSRGSPLREDEVWAILGVSCRSLEDLLERDKSSWASGPSLLITMDTLMMTRGGEVEFCPGHLDINDPGSFAPPETFASNYQITRASVEKMYVYSLGMTIYSAVEFEADKNVEISQELESVLLYMCDETADARHDLSQVLEVCIGHAQRSGCLGFSDQITQLLENLMGSSAVLDTLGRSMDELDDEGDEDANLREELATALRMQKHGVSTGSLRSSNVSTPLGVAPLQNGVNTVYQADDDADVDDANLSELKAAGNSLEPVVHPILVDGSTKQISDLVSATVAVIMAAPPMPLDSSEKAENFADGGVPPHLLESEPPPLPESEPPSLHESSYPDQIPMTESPIIGHDGYLAESKKATVDQSEMQSSSESSIRSTEYQQPHDTTKEEAVTEPVSVAFVQETVESTPVAEAKHIANPIFSAINLLPGASLLAGITGFNASPANDVALTGSETTGSDEPVAQSTPIASREVSTEPEASTSWSGIHADLASAALQVQLRHVPSPEEKLATDPIDEDLAVDDVSTEPPYATVDLTKKKKYRQERDVDTSAAKTDENESTFESVIEMNASESESSNKTEVTDETFRDVLLPHDKQTLSREHSSASETSAVLSKKAKRKRHKKHVDIKSGTMEGDKWQSVTKPSSRKKLKTIFGWEFSRLHGDSRKSSIAIVSLNQTNLPSGRKLVSVIMLDGTKLSLMIEMRSTVRELFDEVAAHLSLKDKEDYFFGLAVKIDDEEWFMEQHKKLKKYAPPGWKDQTKKNVEFLIYFRVKYYVETLNAIKLAQTVHLFFLQLQKDVVEGQMFCHRDSALVLAAYALQANHGDFGEDFQDYFNPEQYIRQSTLSQLPDRFVTENLPKIHKQLSGMTKQQAEIEFMREAQQLSDYGTFFHDVCRTEKGKMGGTVVGASVGGIAIYEVTGLERTPVEKYSWPEIQWVTYKENVFTLVPKASTTGGKLIKKVYYTGSYKRSRYLLQLCTDLHHFRLVITKKLQTESSFSNQGEDELIAESDNDTELQSRSSLLAQTLASESLVLSSERTPVARRGLPNGANSPLPEQSMEVKYVKLVKSPERGLGLMIVGGIDLGKGVGSGIYVKSVKPGGAAALDGRIKPGCQILEVNGQSLENISHSDAVALLHAAPLLVEMKVVQSSLAAAFEQVAVADIEKQQLESLVEEQREAVRVAAVANVEHGLTDQSHVIVVNLNKVDGSLGMEVAGGIDTASRNGAIYVKELRVGGAAHRNGQLQVADRLLRINSHNLLRVRHAEAVQIIKDAGSEVELEVERIMGMDEVSFGEEGQQLDSMSGYESLAGEVIVVELVKDDKGLGFGLVGGQDVNHPIIIKSLFEGQAAEKDGRLKVGDILLEVNNRRIQSMYHKDVVELLRNASHLVRLVVHRPNEPVAIPSDPIVSREESRARSAASSVMREEKSDRSAVDESINLVEVFGEKLLGKKFEVELSRGVKGLGFSVTSGAQSATDDALIFGCFIRTVVSDPALSDGRIQPGDQLLMVNLQSLQGKPHSEAVQILRGMEGEVMKLEVFRRMPPVTLPDTEQILKFEAPSPPISPVSGTMPPLPPRPDSWEDITISIFLRKSDKGYGFNMYVMTNWGVNEATDQSFDCVYVKKITEGMPAAVDGRLHVNDRIIEIDDESVEGLPYYQVINRLRRTEGSVQIKVARREEQKQDERNVSELELVSMPRVIMPITGRCPAASPGERRRDNQLRSNPSIDKSDINELALTQTFERLPTPVPDEFQPGNVITTTARSTLYRGKALEELCQRVDEQLNDQDTVNEYLHLCENRLSADCSVGRLPKNKSKNRFSNLLPFDHSRVKLSGGDENSNYINASTVKMRIGSGFHKFICTQGPLSNTVGDFWRMIWEQHCHVIVMITKLHEAGKDKCHSYWPPRVNQTKTYGGKKFSVTLLSEKNFDTYHVRVLRLKKLGEEGHQNIVHLQFTEWPGHGVPKAPGGFVEFILAVKRAAAARSGAVTVHCSAGMGRTAVAVTVLSTFSMIENDLEKYSGSQANTRDIN